MFNMKTPKKKAGVRRGPGRPAAIQQLIQYRPVRSSSSLFLAAAQKTPSRISTPVIQEVLGRILFALSWPTLTDGDRATLLECADGLERVLIDLRCGELRSELRVVV
jgi:hypothetical protein